MLRLLFFCICIALLTCCAKPGAVGPTIDDYKKQVSKLESEIRNLKINSEFYKDVAQAAQQELDNIARDDNDNDIYGRFDSCSSLMGEMLSFARTHKWLSKTDQERIKFISSLHSSAFNYDKGLAYYKDQEEDPEEYEDGEDDYEQ